MTGAACLCGAVRITVTGDLPAPVACHCTMCRRVSGHVWASVDVPRNSIRIDGADALRWFQSSDRVRRGFCGTCGAAMLFDPAASDKIAIAAGAFDAPIGTALDRHIFTADNGDYYAIPASERQE